LHRVDADVLQRTEAVDEGIVADSKGREARVNAGGHGLEAQLVDLTLVDGELVGEVEVAVHHGGHELGRVVRFQVGGLVADHGIGGSVGFVEAVVGELFQKVEDLPGLLGVDVVGGLAAFDELGRSFAISSAIFLPIARRRRSAPPRE
jgi:hypothetical protein